MFCYFYCEVTRTKLKKFVSLVDKMTRSIEQSGAEMEQTINRVNTVMTELLFKAWFKVS